jgi:hypothetical protein
MKTILSLSLLILGCGNAKAIEPLKKPDTHTYAYVTAENLQAEYIAAPILTEQKYKYARITGTVKEVGKDNVGVARVEFATSDPTASIIARFDADFPGARPKEVLVADCEIGGVIFNSIAANFCKLQVNQGIPNK